MALRRIAKRHSAFTMANPFSVAIVAFCDTYLYLEGVLCYTLDDKIRVLDLHHSASEEFVITIPGLLRSSKALCPTVRSKGSFELIHYGRGILSCLYVAAEPKFSTWLIAFNISAKKIVLEICLPSIEKLFVRNDENHLYYGTHSELDADNFKKWVIRGYSLREAKWLEYQVHLTEMVGSEIGSTICFEIKDGYFYALSNQTSFEVEEIDWTSFYHCIRFPTGSPGRTSWEITRNKDNWRRQHDEGPIDDRWLSLRIAPDERSGKLRIIEARKEWGAGWSRSRRTYYQTDIVFPPRPTEQVVNDRQPDDERGASEGHSAMFGGQDVSTLPENDRLILALTAGDHPNYMRPKRRLPANVHPGDDGSTAPSFTLSKTKLSYFHPAANTYVDLVDHPDEVDWQQRQRLRLRAGSRRLLPPRRCDENHGYAPTDGKYGLLLPDERDGETGEPMPGLHDSYEAYPVRFWPPLQQHSLEQVDPQAEDLDAILNPPSHLGRVEGTADERSLVYVSGGGDQPLAVIFLSFDSSIRLHGIRKWQTTATAGSAACAGLGAAARHTWQRPTDLEQQLEAARLSSSSSSSSSSMVRPGTLKRRHDSTACMGWDTEDSFDLLTSNSGGISKWTPTTTTTKTPTTTTATVPRRMSKPRAAQRTQWCWKAPAMYRDIGRGYDFSI